MVVIEAVGLCSNMSPTVWCSYMDVEAITGQDILDYSPNQLK